MGDNAQVDYPFRQRSGVSDTLESNYGEDEDNYSMVVQPKSGCLRDGCYTRGLNCTEQYVITSLALLCIGAGVLGWDIFCMYVTQVTTNTSQEFAMAILLLHSVAFYQALLAFVYHTQKRHGRSECLTSFAFISVVCNMISFILRLGFEIAYIGYRPECIQSG
ncbi:hypothetical protein LSAT2_024633 [Lamellibrachia satsuma]|nr:hypothetical protein LSAT2_024633 [Lamellibrachia satsuma]